MSNNITISTSQLASGNFENIVIVSGSLSGEARAAVIDYTNYYKELVETHKEIKNILQEINEDIDKLRDLADPGGTGTGIRTITPFGEIGTAALYHLFVRQGQIVAEPNSDSSTQASSLAELRSTIDELRSNFNSF